MAKQQLFHRNKEQKTPEQQAQASAEKWVDKLMPRTLGATTAQDADHAGVTAEVTQLMVDMQTDKLPLMAEAVESTFNAAQGSGKGKIPPQLARRYNLDGKTAKATEAAMRRHAVKAFKYDGTRRMWQFLIVAMSLSDAVLIWGFASGSFEVSGVLLGVFLGVLALFLILGSRNSRGFQRELVQVSFLLALALACAEKGGEWPTRFKKVVN